MAIERFVEVHDTKYFKNDIHEMDKEHLKMLCSFIEKESDLLFIQQHCNENLSYLVDNLIF